MNVGLLLKMLIFSPSSSFLSALKQSEKKVVFSSCDIIYELQSEELCFLFDPIRNCLHNGCMETGHLYSSHIAAFHFVFTLTPLMHLIHFL